MHLINEIRSINKPPYNECFYRKDRKKIEYFFDYLNKLYQSKYSDIHCGMRGLTKNAFMSNF